jgi:hypothetical protein
VRLVDLLTAAAQAERLVVVLETQRRVRAAAYLSVAAAFSFGILIFLHIAIWFWLEPMFGQPVTAVILMIMDLAVSVGMVAAANSGKTKMIAEARMLRDRSLRAMWEFDVLLDAVGLARRSSGRGALVMLLAEGLAALRRR